jgi:hypothetical protein
MPPARPDSPVGWASGPAGVERPNGHSNGQSHPNRRTRNRLRPPLRSDSAPATSLAPTSSALEALLVDLGSQIQRGVSQEAAEAPRPCATGLAALDSQLGGGFPCGRLSEICGPLSSGRTALAVALAGTTLQRGHLAGWVDLADAFDPLSASHSGVDLERLLWIRPHSTEQALRSCDRLLQTEGFELVILDCCVVPGSAPDRGGSRRRRGSGHGSNPARSDTIRDVAWLRLARLAAKTRTALVVLSGTPSTGSRAEIILEMRLLETRFVGPPSLLESLETMATLRRHRTRPSGTEILLSIQSEAIQSEAIQSEAIQSEAIQSEAIQSEVIQSEAIRSETIREAPCAKRGHARGGPDPQSHEVDPGVDSKR